MADQDGVCCSNQEESRRTQCLIVRKYSVTGQDWWSDPVLFWTRLAESDQFKDMDYMIPTFSKEMQGFIPRPGDSWAP